MSLDVVWIFQALNSRSIKMTDEEKVVERIVGECTNSFRSALSQSHVLAWSTAETLRRENKELKARVSELEKQISEFEGRKK